MEMSAGRCRMGQATLTAFGRERAGLATGCSHSSLDLYN